MDLVLENKAILCNQKIWKNHQRKAKKQSNIYLKKLNNVNKKDVKIFLKKLLL